MQPALESGSDFLLEVYLTDQSHPPAQQPTNLQMCGPTMLRRVEVIEQASLCTAAPVGGDLGGYVYNFATCCWIF